MRQAPCVTRHAPYFAIAAAWDQMAAPSDLLGYDDFRIAASYDPIANHPYNAIAFAWGIVKRSVTPAGERNPAQ